MQSETVRRSRQDLHFPVAGNRSADKSPPTKSCGYTSAHWRLRTVYHSHYLMYSGKFVLRVQYFELIWTAWLNWMVPKHITCLHAINFHRSYVFTIHTRLCMGKMNYQVLVGCLMSWTTACSPDIAYKKTNWVWFIKIWGSIETNHFVACYAKWCTLIDCERQHRKKKKRCMVFTLPLSSSHSYSVNHKIFKWLQLSIMSQVCYDDRLGLWISWSYVPCLHDPRPPLSWREDCLVYL